MTVTASDSVGNTGSAASTFLIDLTSPITVATPEGSTGSNGWWVSAVTVHLDATDPAAAAAPYEPASSGVAETYWRVDGGAWSQGNEALIDGEGHHVIEYYSVDSAGNVERPSSLAIAVDLTDPLVAISAPSASTYLFGSNLTAAFGASDAVSGVSPEGPTALLNQVPVANGATFACTTPGTNSFVVIATDNAGRTSQSTIPFVVAFTPGSITPSPGTSIKAGSTANFEFTVLDGRGVPTDAAIANIEADVGGTPLASGPAILKYSGSSPSYTYQLRTLKGLTGTMSFNITLNDGVTVWNSTYELR